MAQDFHIRLAIHRVNPSVAVNCKAPPICTPGQIISTGNDFMRGHGTYQEGSCLKSSVAGVKEQINNLISVHPLKNRYSGKIGDVVVGRISEVRQKKWKVNTNSRLDSILMLSSVNLPGGELRRRSTEDEYMMRHYLREGDLISAEVQTVFADGTLSLHTRSLKYGKLTQGTLIRVSPNLIQRSKTHFYNLYVGASIILGTNGYIWLYPTPRNLQDNVGGYVPNLEVISKSERETIGRLRNCILSLKQSKMLLCDTSILFAFEESLKYSVSELLVPEAMVDVAILTKDRLSMLEIY